MALKTLIDNVAFDALSVDLQKEYKINADGKYHLDVEDDPAFAAVKEEKRKATERAEAAEADLAARTKADEDAAEELRIEKEKAAKASGDVTALEASWQEKYDKDIGAAKEEGVTATAMLAAVFVNKVAADMAAEICTVPELLTDVIKNRLRVEVSEGQPITRVLSGDGKASALSLDDLKKELVDNPAYATIIKASDAQGGGAGGGDGGSGASKKLSEMTATEESAYANANPVEYQRMVDAADG